MAHPMHRSLLTQDATVTDLFCGAGGSSIGAVAAGARLHMAANHWRVAVDSHAANFPAAHHDCADISQVDPRRYPRTTILLASPECTHHSIARTKRHVTDLFDPKGDPAAERSRATMWDVVRFAEHHRYEIVVVENVVEVHKWEPFGAWLAAMDSLGYHHKVLCLNSMIAWPTPQSRDRVYMVFWRKGNRAPDLDLRARGFCQDHGEVDAVQVWKRPGNQFGKFRQQYLYRCPDCAEPVAVLAYPAASAIDFSLPCPRIGDRARPLSDATMRRIELGLDRYGPNFIMQRYGHTFERPGYARAWPMTNPLPTQMTDIQHGMIVPLHHGARGPAPRSVLDVWPTQTGQQEQALAMPFIAELRGGGSDVRPINQPAATFCANGNHHGLCTPPGFLVKNYGDGTDPSMSLGFGDPLATVTTQDHHSVVQIPESGPVLPPFLMSYYGKGGCSPIEQPVPTMRTHDGAALVAPAIDPMGCGFRMLSADEVGRAMAFPASYLVTGTSRDRVKQYGNGVTPPIMGNVVGRAIASLAPLSAAA